MNAMTLPNGPVKWDQIRLVVFDLDGTLYDQRRLRAVMLLRLALHVANSRSLVVLHTLRAFRHCREKLGETLAADFATRQYELTAHGTGCSADAVKAMVEEWIDRRPLDVLRACRYRGVENVFAALVAQRKTLAVLSDYPAREKLQVLGLDADIIVCSSDPDVGVLKPHPAGLQRVLNLANVPAQAAIMIGDRVDRDWAVAQKHGMRALIRSRKPIAGIDTFRDYEDKVFQTLIGRTHK
jgi:FMN phosphatase YigB (HAD superfamily)